MSIPLRIIEQPGADWKMSDSEPGTMWRVTDYDTEDREGWVVVLPGPTLWWTTLRSVIRGTRTFGPMWEVTGQPPNITVSPSIDCSPGWHGWIRNGELVDA